MRDSNLVREILPMAAVHKFAKHFGKLMVFQDEGDVGLCVPVCACVCLCVPVCACVCLRVPVASVGKHIKNKSKKQKKTKEGRKRT